jgi:hypothetical protein
MWVIIYISSLFDGCRFIEQVGWFLLLSCCPTLWLKNVMRCIKVPGSLQIGTRVWQHHDCHVLDRSDVMELLNWRLWTRKSEEWKQVGDMTNSSLIMMVKHPMYVLTNVSQFHCGPITAGTAKQHSISSTNTIMASTKLVSRSHSSSNDMTLVCLVGGRSSIHIISKTILQVRAGGRWRWCLDLTLPVAASAEMTYDWGEHDYIRELRYLWSISGTYIRTKGASMTLPDQSFR